MTTQTKTIEFSKLIPDFKRFAVTNNRKKYNEQDDLLRLVHFDGKHLMVTDSHRMLRVNAEHVEGLPSYEPFLYDMKTNEIVTRERDYPDLKRYFNYDWNTRIALDRKNITEVRKSVTEVLKTAKEIKNNTVNISIKDNTLTITDTKNKDIKMANELVTIGQNIDFHMNCKYFNEALMTTNKLLKLSKYDDRADLNIIGSFMPIQINKDDIFNILVLPVRVS